MAKAYQLAKSFSIAQAYQEDGYELLPFRFMRLDQGNYLLTNLVGEFVILRVEDFHRFIEGTLQPGAVMWELKSKHFLFSTDSRAPLELLATKYRTQKAHLSDFTALHIFVVTLRCDHSCQYCQVSRVSEDRASFDMTRETAVKAIDLMLKSPSRYLKVEFQGGESLLNFELIQFVTAQTIARAQDRAIEFVIASNLSHLTDEMLSFAKTHHIKFSCSLDGPASLHNANRPRPGRNSHELTKRGIERIRDALGKDGVSALMTTTARSLYDPRSIIDEYVAQGFDSIFLRWVSPYGFAAKAGKTVDYHTQSYLAFYKQGLDYIIELNLRGVSMREEYAAIITHKLLRPFAHGYVDLQSPSGLGLCVMVYNYDGDVYASDEGRMLAEMGDTSFRMGNVHADSYEDLFLNSPVLETALETMLEGVPGCSDCALLPYCGVDPVLHHTSQGDPVGHKPTSAFCERNMGIMLHILSILRANDERAQVLKSWV